MGYVHHSDLALLNWNWLEVRYASLLVLFCFSAVARVWEEKGCCEAERNAEA